MNMRAYELEDFIGEHVISRSGNELEPLKIGILVGYEEHHSGSSMPIVRFGDKEYLCFTSILPFSDVLFEMLSKLSPEEQMDEMTRIKHFVGANSRKCRGKTLIRHEDLNITIE
jgi:hypothetical protein